MGFLSRTKEIISGKSDIERKQESLANAEIRKQVLAAQLRERKEQAIKFAQESEKIKYQQRLKQLKQPKQGFGNIDLGLRNYGSITGSPRIMQERTITKPLITKKKKGKKRKSRTRVIYRTIKQPQSVQQSRWDVLGI